MHRRGRDVRDAAAPDAGQDPESPRKVRPALQRARLCAGVVVALLVLLWLGGGTQFLVRTARVVAQSPAFNRFRLVMSRGARETYARAEEYYAEHYPKVRASAEGVDGFEVHWYFSTLEVPTGDLGQDVSWYDLIGARIRAWYVLLQGDGRDDFRVEKDRCEMYSFFAREGLPHTPVAKAAYGAADVLVPQLRSGAFFEELAAKKEALKYPLFLKACHLTQGAMKAVLTIPSADHLTDPTKLAAIAAWGAEKLTVKADDWERSWRREGNALTDTLAPGLLVQEAFQQTWNPYKQREQVIELKVEVLWGYPYLAVTSDFYPGTVFLRNGEVEIFPDNLSQLFFAASHTLHKDLAWVPSHLPCVWALASRAARRIQADNVRIDIFLDPSSPEGCLLNEISLSSGMQYGMHFPFLTMAWGLPARERAYRIASDRVSPVYHPTSTAVPPQQ